MTLLPETEVLRRQLEKEVVGQQITAVSVRPSAGLTPDEFARALEGRCIEAVIRRGTSLALRLGGGSALVMRSGAVAALTRNHTDAGVDERADVVLEFDGGGALHCMNVEQNGPLRLVTVEELDTSAEFVPMGMDPLTQSATWLELSRQLVIRNCRLRALLGDETFVIGLGDVYSDEILWAAGLSGMRMSSKLSAQEVRRLYRAIQEVLHEAVKQGGGASDPAEEGEDPFDDPLANQHLKVFGRSGQPCVRCRRTIVFACIDDPPVPSYFCPSCQT